MPPKRSCTFCPLPPTLKRGEHIFDDWLNRVDGKPISEKFTFTQTGENGEVLRTFRKSSMDTTAAVVCDTCNHGWMSDLTNHTKATAEGFIRHHRAATILPLGIVTLTAFAFMKAAVVDAERKTGFISPSLTQRFGATQEPPPGVQLWLGCFFGRHLMSAHVWSDALLLRSGAFKGYHIYVFTYQVGHLALQLTYPRWAKSTRKRPPLPALTQHEGWDEGSVLIWPGVTAARWPPPKHLNSETLKIFKNRFGNLVGPPRL
jgi:hypothetical protein